MLYEGLRENFNQPVRLIVETILKSLNDGLYQDLLLSELPEILSQEQVRIDEFLTKGLADAEDDVEDSKDRVENCNLETKLRDPGLPFLGKPNTHYLEQKSLANIYDLREEL